MPELVGYLLLFTLLGVAFIFVHLVAGRFIRPVRPDPEKQTVYECGEPTIGSSWIQFDLRFYVVALLFVIFDVEVAFFFPWAVVFGKSNALSRENLPAQQRLELSQELVPPAQNMSPADVSTPTASNPEPITPAVAHNLAWIAFLDIIVFFGVLLVGFAYLWKRGDLDWVRSTAAEKTPVASTEEPAPPLPAAVLVGAGRG